VLQVVRHACDRCGWIRSCFSNGWTTLSCQDAKDFWDQIKRKLPHWVSAKDIILEMLRRYGVRGGVDCILEYYGPGLKHLTAMDRHVIATWCRIRCDVDSLSIGSRNAEVLQNQRRPEDWQELLADKDAKYDLQDEIDFINTRASYSIAFKSRQKWFLLLKWLVKTCIKPILVLLQIQVFAILLFQHSW